MNDLDYARTLLEQVAAILKKEPILSQKALSLRQQISVLQTQRKMSEVSRAG